MKNSIRFLALAAIVTLLGQGCPLVPKPQTPITPPQPAAPAPGGEPTVEKKDEAMMEEKKGAGTYEPYSKAKYDAYVAADVPIVLYFYANWCPICRAEEPEVKKIIEESNFDVRMIRVNYNDTDTDEDEKKLAKEFRITYQHTFVYLDGDGKEINRTIGARSETQYHTDINALR